jgi:hypothetical protein
MLIAYRRSKYGIVAITIRDLAHIKDAEAPCNRFAHVAERKYCSIHKYLLDTASVSRDPKSHCMQRNESRYLYLMVKVTIQQILAKTSEPALGKWNTCNKTKLRSLQHGYL